MEKMEKYFRYLDHLRESAVTNMYGASPYVQERFGLGSKRASEVVGLWMKTFDPDKTIAERVALASAE